MAARRMKLLSMLQQSARIQTGRQNNSVRLFASVTQGGGEYVSPFQEIFNTIEEGKTFLGSEEFRIPETKFLKCGVPENVLRFKTTTYGRLLEEPYVRPNEHRITLQVPVSYIPLNDIEQIALREIVGTRLNEETGLLQLSSAQFGSRIENKRHVVSMLDRIVDSTKSLASKVQAEIGSMETANA
mmetsp:Transcript_6995/g.16369  ORF Transcript_6995/g.16369 Transcript_6995/m.16369 type:complete len:185 (-) Transcript_6995:127-681(-)